MPSNEAQTKAQRREAARAEALALREAQAKRDKRNRLITIGALVAGVLVLVGVFLAVWIPAMKDQNKTIDAVAAGNLADVTSPSTARDDGGIPMGVDGAAGTENDGAVEVGVYLDYMCPVCGQFEDTNGASLDQLRESGDVTVVLHPVAILDRFSTGSQYSTRAASAAAWVADRAPEAMNEFNALMFAQQPAENTKGLTDEQIADLAEQAGVPADVAAGIADGTAAETFADWSATATSLVTQDEALAGERGFGTPTVTINGEVWGKNGEWQDPAALPAAVQAAAGTSTK
jgi:protein-disulfide isomerase